jgi:DNA-3-methyladenine glycosylase I
MRDYKGIFERIEATLLEVGAETLPFETIQAELDKFRFGKEKTFTDEDYFWILVYVVFYAGFRAATVGAKIHVIREHFPSFGVVASYGEADIERIMSEERMIRHEAKIKACVKNAQTYAGIVHKDKFGSFRKYIDSFAPRESVVNLIRLKKELQSRFKRFAKVTPYHFLTDIGLPVLKPDRVICRIFQRLGLIESETHIEEAVIQGGKFAEATGHPIRYIDIIFVAYGQMTFAALGLTRGICLEQNPLCSRCKAKQDCNYFQRTGLVI